MSRVPYNFNSALPMECANRSIIIPPLYAFNTVEYPTVVQTNTNYNNHLQNQSEQFLLDWTEYYFIINIWTLILNWFFWLLSVSLEFNHHAGQNRFSILTDTQLGNRYASLPNSVSVASLPQTDGRSQPPQQIPSKLNGNPINLVDLYVKCTT